MSRKSTWRKAQSTMEYALLISIVIGAFSAMQIYLKRSMQGKLKGGSDGAVDYIVLKEATLTGGKSTLFGTLNQFEPVYGASAMETTTQDGTEQFTQDKESARHDVRNQQTTRNGYQASTGGTGL